MRGAERCKQPATFDGVDELLFLKVHHVRKLAKGGSNTMTEQLRRILFQPTVANFAMIEPHLDHLEGVLDLGTQLRLGVFDLALDSEQQAAFTVVLVTAWPCSNRPGNVPFSMLRSLGRTGVPSVTRNIGFGTVQQLVDLGDIRHVGGRPDQAVHQPRRGAYTNVGLHPEVPLIAFLA